MKLNTVSTALVATTIAALSLSGCGSDHNDAAPDTSAAAGAAACAGKNALTAEGSTSQQNAIALFNQAWAQACGTKNVSYNPTGSGAGRDQFIANHVDFAGSDSTLTPEQVPAAAKRCGGNPAWHLPLVFGPIGLAYHLDGVDTLVLNGDVLAKIFSGAVTAWNDPAIGALNPGAALPATKITPIYRSDSSGTTDNFQQYLAATAPQSWTKGAGSEFAGGVGEGADKSAGVVQAVQTTPGAIGYVEQGFTDQANLRIAQLDSGAGAVPLTDSSARAAIEAATFETEGSNDLRLDLNSLYGAKAAGAYPLVLATYEIVCSKGYAPDTSAAVRSFLTVAANNGQGGLAAAGYIPLPERFKERLVSAIDAIG
ncbi:phosphate ABC transporter substrate-binding protein PstS [Mycobacterium talmoniae]|uniref:Phosphate-binding protein n=1 Tax=Mycobacterium talmoniae TaxID=1858794 RepID=A0A1S1NBF4_9MYCO|nr:MULTISPECIES: phosphate ABC transporter substrate-binding protein PstS [Mycobacterium]OHV00903.1 phosphate ABC transporter substrate-binding protein PstS [Mycobacterium talmoniae]TDH49869.1 phosphate ABC transporter substrate-binding protein PstS [Mycobacterium eburneum]